MLLIFRLQPQSWLLLFLCLCGLPQVHSHYTNYDHWDFEQRVARAKEAVDEILEQERNVQLAEYQEHTYNDKFVLVEQLTHSAWLSVKSLLTRLGLDLDKINAKDGLTLAFSGKTKCEFDREEEVEVIASETEITTTGKTQKVRDIQRVKQYIWNVTDTYALYACLGSSCDDLDSRIKLRGRDRSTTVSTRAKPENSPVLPRDVFESLNLTWWAKQVSENVRGFSVDRNSASCKTPLNNKEVGEVLEFHVRFNRLHSLVTEFLYFTHAPSGTQHLPMELQQYARSSLMPFLDNSTVLSAETLDRLRITENAELDRILTTVGEQWPDADKGTMTSADEAVLYHLLHILGGYFGDYRASVYYVEGMLRKQLVDAIGKEISHKDFDQYMQFHSKKLFANHYVPVPFSHAIRQPNEYPVGIASIETSDDENQPIQTFAKRFSGENMKPIRVPIDAATAIDLIGDRYLSGWIQYQFDSSSFSSGVRSNLVARARQFSSFILLIGTMSGPETFDPKQAIILQNKDEVIIPLMTEVLPSAKEFKDAIASLSPEQQEFARAFRAMQLESSVFAVCLIQLKPQLEALLNLPKGSLSKEIQLTEDLMTLFVDYQIPSDLLSYDGPPDAAFNPEKLEMVRKAVAQVMKIIADAKEKELEDEKQRAKMKEATMYETMAASSFYADSVLPSNSPNASPSSTGASATRRARSVSMDSVPPMNQQSVRGAQQGTRRLNRADASTRVPQHDSNAGPPPSPLSGEKVDFTAIPGKLDAMLEEHDTESYLRSTIIKAATTNWTRKRQENLLSALSEETLDASAITSERRKAFDLLDAISRSGTLPIASSELHVVVGMTHCFENSLIETVVHDNINPIEKAEKSALMVAVTIFGTNAPELIGSGDGVKRLSASFPALFEIDSAGVHAKEVEEGVEDIQGAADS